MKEGREGRSKREGRGKGGMKEGRTGATSRMEVQNGTGNEDTLPPGQGRWGGR